MGELLPPELASDIIKRMNPYLRPLHSQMQYVWLDKNILYIQMKGQCACDRTLFVNCTCQESHRIKETITMLLKEDLDFIDDVIFLPG
jgi:hypothetical protein